MRCSAIERMFGETHCNEDQVLDSNSTTLYSVATTSGVNCFSASGAHIMPAATRDNGDNGGEASQAPTKKRGRPPGSGNKRGRGAASQSSQRDHRTSGRDEIGSTSIAEEQMDLDHSPYERASPRRFSRRGNADDSADHSSEPGPSRASRRNLGRPGNIFETPEDDRINSSGASEAVVLEEEIVDGSSLQSSGAVDAGTSNPQSNCAQGEDRNSRRSRRFSLRRPRRGPWQATAAVGRDPTPSLKELASRYPDFLLFPDDIPSDVVEYPNSDPAVNERNFQLISEKLRQIREGPWRAPSLDEKQAYEKTGEKMDLSALHVDPMQARSSPHRDAERSRRTHSSAAFREASTKTGRVLEIALQSDKTVKSVTLSRGQGIALSRALQDDYKPGLLLNAGGHVYSLDWSPCTTDECPVQYLAVAVSQNESSRTSIAGDGNLSPNAGLVQIWSTDLGTKADLELTFGLSEHRITSLRWAPILPGTERGLSKDIVGILAVASTDGSIGIYVVPRPSSLTAKSAESLPLMSISPILRLDAGQGSPISLEWYGNELLAAGHSDGYLSVWSLSDALSLPSRLHPCPAHLCRASRSALADISFSTYGDFVFSASYDGTISATPLDEGDFDIALNYQRNVCYATGYHHHLAAPIFERFDDLEVKYLESSNHEKLSARSFQGHRGRTRVLASTPFHPFVASGSADGVVQIGNAPLLVQSKKKGCSDTLALYRLEVNRGTGDLRSIENILPPSFQKTDARQSVKTSAKPASLHGWHPALCITALRWNRNANCEAWIASGSAAGTVRIDYAGFPPTDAFSADEAGEAHDQSQ